jgi:hypothetical protein
MSAESTRQSNLTEINATPCIPKKRTNDMAQDKQPSQEQHDLMQQYGITHENKSLYFYQGYKYDKLSDAIRYAKESSGGAPTTASASTD